MVLVVPSMSHGLSSEVWCGGVSATPKLGPAVIFSKTDLFSDKSDYLSHPLFFIPHALVIIGF